MAVETAYVIQAQVDAHLDYQVLHRTDVGDRVGHAPAPLARQMQQRVADELARAVEGDIAAPVGPLEVRSHLLWWSEQVLHRGPDAQGVHRVVLEEQQVVVGPVGVDGSLESQGVPVAHPAEPSDPEWSRPGRHVHPTTRTWTA